MWPCRLPHLGSSSQCLKNTLGTGIYRNRGKVAPRDDAVFVDHEESAFAATFVAAVGSKFFCDLALWLKVGEQRKVQMAVLREGVVAPGAINGNADQFGAVFLKLREDFVVERHLVAAYGAPIGGIKSQDDRASAQLGEREFLVGRDRERKIRRGRAGL